MIEQVEQYRREQDALERQRKEESDRERLKDYDFIRALFEMACPGVKNEPRNHN